MRDTPDLPETFLGESVSGTGFKVSLEGLGTAFVWKGGGKNNLQWDIRGGGWIFAAVVLTQTAVEVPRQTGVAEGRSGAAL